MKKSVILLVAAILASGFMYAQKRNVVSAYNYLRKDKLEKAKEAIDPAIEHEKTKDDAKTWLYYGNVYLSINQTDDEEFENLDDNPLDKAYNAYLKAKKLDEKGEYTDQIENNIQTCAQQYFNSGVLEYNANNYEEASDAFARSSEINATLGRTDSAAIFYAGQTAYLGQQYEESKEFFEKSIEIDYLDPTMFRMLADAYKQTGDTTAAAETLQKGLEEYPDEYTMITDAANIYLLTGENEKALDMLNRAIEREDSNATLFFAAGTVYENMDKYEEAGEMYKKALEVDPNYFDANFNLGALYFNKALEYILEAGNLPLEETDKYDSLLKQGNELMEKALPSIEKADTLQPNDPIILQSLKEIYTRLKMMEKLKGINERLSE